MKKINKEFVLSDSSVNTYGYRLLTSGYQLEEFAKNPIGYYMHERQNGVLVRWEDLQIKGDIVVGKPAINESNARAKQTIEEVENGFLNAASFGHLVVIEASDDPALKLPGQTGPTITKWFNRECSLVDVPANTSALVLYDLKGHVLSNLSTAINNGVIIPAPLSSTASLAPRDNLRNEDLLREAIKDCTITPEQAGLLKKQYQGEQSYKLEALLKDFAAMRIESLMNTSWNELDKSGLSEELNKKYNLGYKLKTQLEFVNNYDKLVKFGLENKVWKDREINLIQMQCDNVAKLKAFLEKAIKNLVDGFKSCDWDNMTADNREQLKQHYFQLYKCKYQTKFGIPYKD